MSFKSSHSLNLKLTSLFQFFLLLIAAMYIITADAQAGGSNKYPKCYIGTYLVEEGSGTASTWTLGARGVITITSSAQKALNFSDAQGAWISTGKLEAQATLVDFSFDNEGALLNIAKINVDMNFTDKNCEAVEGSFTVYFYQPDVDPLDPDSVPDNILTDTFTGQRINVEQ